MWENCHDYDAEVEAQMKPQPEQPNPIDLDRLEALHAEATRFYANGRIELTHDDETARRWAVVIFEAFPALLAELKDLRARVAELSSGAVELTDGTKEYNDLIAERDRLRAELAAEGKVRTQLRGELTAANDTIAGLREALEHQEAALCIIRDRQLGQVSVKDIDQGIGQIRAALSRTPDQHRARIKAAGLREAAVRLRKQDCSDEAVRTYEWLTDEAERLEKGVGNGIHG